MNIANGIWCCYCYEYIRYIGNFVGMTPGIEPIATSNGITSMMCYEGTQQYAEEKTPLEVVETCGTNVKQKQTEN